MTGSTEIFSETLQPPDWFAIGLLEPKPAADALRRILKAWEGAYEEAETRLGHIREYIFNIRMCCFRIVSERELWKLEIDPEYGIPYKSMGRWIQVLYPKEEGLRYALKADATQKALPAATVADLGKMKQCNAVPLAHTSESCRADRTLIDATKTASEKEFRATLNRDHGQAVEPMEILRVTLPKSAYDQIKADMKEFGEQWNIQDEAGQIEGIFEDWRQGGHKETA